MRNLGLVLGFTLLVGCGGSATERDACEHIAACLADASDPPPSQSELDDFIDECAAEAVADNVSQACLDCVEDASCSSIVAEDACEAECSDDTGTDDVATDGGGV